MNEEQKTLRETFHKVGSLLFEITLASGVSKESLQDILREYNEIKGKPQASDMGKALENIEKAAMNIDALLSKIKGFVYKQVNPDIYI
ncbi:hypothetical protein ACFL2W_00110 [Candidatus Omnitrophota bacterium]